MANAKQLQAIMQTMDKEHIKELCTETQYCAVFACVCVCSC